MKRELIVAGFVALLCWVFTSIMLVTIESRVNIKYTYTSFVPLWMTCILWSWLFIGIATLVIGILRKDDVSN